MSSVFTGRMQTRWVAGLVHFLQNYMYITKKLQDAPNQKEKDEILEALKNSSMIIYFFINMFGIYDFQSHSKKTHRLIVLNETKGFMEITGLKK